MILEHAFDHSKHVEALIVVELVDQVHELAPDLLPALALEDPLVSELEQRWLGHFDHGLILAILCLEEVKIAR